MDDDMKRLLASFAALPLLLGSTPAFSHIRPLYAFGHGLSYTRFAYDGLAISGGETVTATFTVTNTGDREGSDVPQLYLTAAPNEKRMRLLDFERVC